MDELTAREIGKKYTGTCGMVHVKGESKPIPVGFGDLRQDDDGTYSFDLVINTHNRTEENVIKGYGLSFTGRTVALHKMSILPMPDRQVFDCDGITYVYSRHPNRQYQKGVCQGNTSVSSPVTRLLEETLPIRTTTYEVSPRRAKRISIENLYNLFDPTYAETFHTALEEIDKFKLLSRALTQEYFISLFPHEEHQYVLFRLEVPVAYYNRDNDIFTVIDKVYEQELQDFCRRHNINSRIEV